MQMTNCITFKYQRLLIVLLLCIFPFAVSAEQWIYKDLIDPAKVIRIETNPDNMAVDGKMVAAKFCLLDSEYICIRAGDFTFYFPKEIKPSMTSWKVDGRSYKVSSSHSASFFGVEYEVYVVTQEVPKGLIYYIYSKMAGLLAIGGKGSGTSTMYLLDSRCGYGAAADCN